MTNAGYGSELLLLLEARGWSTWELARAAEVKLELANAALGGSGSLPVEALRRMAHVLDAELRLLPTPWEPRQIGPVESVVDKAVRVLEERQAAAVAASGGGRLPDEAGAFIHEQRNLLERLAEFASTPGFLQLQRTLAGLGVSDGAAAWLCQFLMQRAFELGEMPLDVVQRPGGLGVVDAHIRRLILNPIGG